ncbi:MAG: hypothetical protein PHX48_00900 [Bacteroidales bacterium]|nr:hypothetical protein [Bacteroidales bacterium]
MKKIILVTLFIGLSLMLSFFSFAQDTYQPKNLKQAVKFLDKTCAKSLKDSIVITDDKYLYDMFDFRAKYTCDDYYIREWTSYYKETKLKKYLKDKGIPYKYNQVVISSFKYYLINGRLDEDKVLKPFIEEFKKLSYEDERRKTLDTLRGVYIPKNLDDCFKQLGVLLDDSTIIMIKGMEEEKLISNYHFGLGMWLRNNWQLWGGSRLSYYFNNMGISEPDDMSSIIIKSYRRYLKGEDIKLEEQIKYYQDYWKEQKEYIEQQNELEFNNFNIGDTISYRYDCGFVSKEQKEKYYNRDCVATGIVLAKNTNEKLIQVKIIECCDKKGIVVLKTEYEFNEKLDKWVEMEKPIIKKAKKGKTQWFAYNLWNSY